MNLKDIVCDFEYAEKLNELGLKRKGIFFYGFLHKDIKTPQDCRHDDELPTYTVAELGEMLPAKITHHQHGELFLEFEKLSYENYNDGYTCNYTDVVSGKNRVYTDGEKEANARAKLLIWLIENNHVNVEDLNK